MMNIERSYNKRQTWKAISSIVIVAAGAACFILSVIVAMVTLGKE